MKVDKGDEELLTFPEFVRFLVNGTKENLTGTTTPDSAPIQQKKFDFTLP